MKVAWPLALLVPLIMVVMELPLPGVKETVLPLTGLPSASLRVTVIVEVDEPSATTDVGLATTVDVPALTAPGFTVNKLLVPVMLLLPPIPVAVMVKLPVFVMVTL